METEIDPLIDKLIFKKYRITKLLTIGSCSKVYQGINISTNKNVALKLEKRSKDTIQLLEKECYYLHYLKFPGIPNVLSYGITKKYNILVLDLFGKSLEELNIIKKFNIKDVCMIGLEIIDRLEYIHSKYIIHRDIKPENFLISLQDPSFIYIIDFGLSSKYRSTQTQKHIRFSKLKKFFGNFKYISVNGINYMELSRRDDLESLCYMLIEFAKGALPWQNLEGKNMDDLYYKIKKMKNEMKEEKVCEKLPNEFLSFLKYTKRLKFEENPDYNYLRGLLNMVLNKINQENDFNFSWINQKNMKIKTLDERVKRLKIGNLSFSRKKTSPQVKLLRKIEKSISKEKLVPKKDYKSENGFEDEKYFYLKRQKLNMMKNNNYEETTTEGNSNNLSKKNDFQNYNSNARKLNNNNNRKIIPIYFKNENLYEADHQLYNNSSRLYTENNIYILKHIKKNSLIYNKNKQKVINVPFRQAYTGNSKNHFENELNNFNGIKNLSNSDYPNKNCFKKSNSLKKLSIDNPNDFNYSLMINQRTDTNNKNNYNIIINKNKIPKISNTDFGVQVLSPKFLSNIDKKNIEFKKNLKYFPNHSRCVNVYQSKFTNMDKNNFLI